MGEYQTHIQSEEISRKCTVSLSQCWLSEQPCLPGMGLPQYPWEAWPRANVAMAVRAGGSLAGCPHLVPCRWQRGWTLIGIQTARGLGMGEPFLSPWPSYNELTQRRESWPPLHGFLVQTQLSFSLAAFFKLIKPGLKKASPHSKVDSQLNHAGFLQTICQTSAFQNSGPEKSCNE